jgi:hypothetical protein
MSPGAVRCPVIDFGVKAKKHEIRTANLGAMDTMLRERTCTLDSCKSAAVAVLAEQNLCLNHFFSYCYDHLELFDPRSRRSRNDALDIPARRRFVEECSRAALDLSFRCETLTNLQRARLLDIMLWAGELFLLLRVPGSEKAQASTSSASPFPARRTIPATPELE